MDRKGVIVRLYYVLIHADGQVSRKEMEWGQEMAKIEGFEPQEFRDMVMGLSGADSSEVMEEALTGLRQLETDSQIRMIAWLSVIANADGFMDSREWKIIYRLYHQELKLELKDVLQEQIRIIDLVSLKTLSNFKNHPSSPVETKRATLRANPLPGIQ
jgi:uncharacterized tellurite resistance protein B-like protein